jgi:hypothetical protein
MLLIYKWSKMAGEKDLELAGLPATPPHIPSSTCSKVTNAVLPDRTAASPLFGDNSPLFQIFLKFRYFSDIFGLFIQVNT